MPRESAPRPKAGAPKQRRRAPSVHNTRLVNSLASGIFKALQKETSMTDRLRGAGCGDAVAARSWSSCSERAAPDIIDLDRYMRPRRRNNDTPASDPSTQFTERLVVDAGGGGRKQSTSVCSAVRDKRYSHDSGLSDGSYMRKRTHRRVVAESPPGRGHRERERERELTHLTTSTNSMRTFRIACERALRDQQEQIARVAQLCERLTARAWGGREGLPACPAPPATPAPPRRPPQPHSNTNDSSDISSSSRTRSSRDRNRKDRHRTDECKTYKIIMTKLDELNRLFVNRSRNMPPRRALGPGGRLREPSAGSVTMSDKIISTETPPRHHPLRPRNKQQVMAVYDVRTGMSNPQRLPNAPFISSKPNRRTVQIGECHPSGYCHRGGHISTENSGIKRDSGHTSFRKQGQFETTAPRLVERGVGGGISSGVVERVKMAPAWAAGGASRGAGGRARGGATRAARLAAACALDLDIAPAGVKRSRTKPRYSGCLNVATESVMECDSSASSSTHSVRTARYQYHQEDPVELIKQAARLQKLHRSSGRRRARSADHTRNTDCRATCPKHAHSHTHASLCSVCRGYWRTLTTLASQLFSRLDPPP